MRRHPTPEAEAHVVPGFFLGGWVENRRSRPAIFCFSLSAHMAFTAFLVLADWSALRPLPVTPDAEILAAESERRIVFYNLSRDLPPVTPLEHVAGEQGARAAKLSLRQTIVANDPGPASDTQKIWDPASDRILEQEVQTPNIVASSPGPERFRLEQPAEQSPAAEPLPSTAAPVAPQPSRADLNLQAIVRLDRLRFQQQRREPVAPAAQAIEAASAPRVDPAVPPGAKIEDLSSFERLRFESAGRNISRPESRPLEAHAAPEINPASVPALNLEQLQALERIRYRMSVPANEAPARQVLEAGTAPHSGPAAAPQSDLSTIYRTETLRYSGTTRASSAPGAEALSRIATGPPPISGSGQAAATRTQTAGESLLTGNPTVPAPLPPPAANTSVEGKGTGGAGAGDLAVVGLKPSPTADLNVPRGRRPGSFSASPNGGGNGRIGMPGNENAARVPNLSVSQSGRYSRPAVPTVVPGEGSGVWKDSEKPAQTLMSLNRLTGPGSVDRLSAADLERAAKAPPEPHERAPLEDRTVYTMAINMPNISSYQGSWIVRYAQLEEEKDEAPFSAPAPLRKVDPKYVAQAALEGIEGEVLLYAVITSVGGVGDAKVMRGIDERLDQSALEAIGKWQFTPAKRGGESIAVEALFSIPFQLSKLKQ